MEPLSCPSPTATEIRSYMKYNRVSLYPFNHLHAQYLDPSTFAMLDGDNPK